MYMYLTLESSRISLINLIHTMKLMNIFNCISANMLGKHYYLNMCGSHLNELEMRNIPRPRLELTTHVTTKTVQVCRLQVPIVKLVHMIATRVLCSIAGRCIPRHPGCWPPHGCCQGRWQQGWYKGVADICGAQRCRHRSNCWTSTHICQTAGQ